MKRYLMPEKEKLSASLEDYLESIFHVVKEKQAARAKDIAERLKVNNSSVTGALRNLSEKGYINYAPYDLITLTDKGEELAKDIVRRHEVLKDFFIKILQISKPEAEETACKLEHDISPVILDRLIQFIEFISICPRGGEDWIKSFAYYCKQAPEIRDCKLCLGDCVNEIKERKSLIADKKQSEISLSELDIKKKAILSDLSEKNSILRKMDEIEANPGNLVEIEAIDEKNNILSVKIRGHHLDLDLEDAEKIMVLPC